MMQIALPCFLAGTLVVNAYATDIVLLVVIVLLHLRYTSS